MRVLLFAVEPLIRRVSACLVVRRVTSAPTQCGNCGGYPPYLCMGPSPRLHATVVGRTRPCLAGTPHSRNNFRSDDHCRGGHVLRRPPPSMRNPGDYPHSIYHYRRSFMQFVAQHISITVEYHIHTPSIQNILEREDLPCLHQTHCRLS